MHPNPHSTISYTAAAAAASSPQFRNLRLVAPSAYFLGPASIATATRRVHSTVGGVPSQFLHGHYYKPLASIGDALLFHHHLLLARHFFPPMMLTSAADLRATRTWWVSKQDEDAVEVMVAMPGLPMERVKVWANKTGLFVKGDEREAGVKGPADDGTVQDLDPALYSCHIGLSADEFNLDKAKAEMKHGLLKVTVPRVKGTEIKIE